MRHYRKIIDIDNGIQYTVVMTMISYESLFLRRAFVKLLQEIQ